MGHALLFAFSLGEFHNGVVRQVHQSIVQGFIHLGGLLTIDGEVYEVTRMFHVIDAMLNARVTSSVVINVTRGTEKLDLTVKLKNSDIVNADS